ncbi:MAG: PQQ-dependent sugar dehydrogenase [Pirellulaceae bacterium]
MPAPSRRMIALCFLTFAGFGSIPIVAQDIPEPQQPTIAAASDEGLQALDSFRLNDDLSASLFAAEPLLANPVAIYVDHQGRVFVCETFRQGNAVVDNRSFNDTWVDADLAAQTVEDRRQFFTEQLGTKLASYMEQDDRIRLLIDSDHDGRADESHVFSDHYNDTVDGTGAGILEHNGNVYYTCIPDLYLLQDPDGDHQAEVRKSLHTGYGVRVAFRGHDSHGLVIGPDGRLYFSIGDRGANVTTDQGQLINVESGSVFRCELDGSNLEIFATGLRNPQELAFDDFGNLFTGDNNSDSGDKARWVYVVQGSDSGWRMAYQYLADRGPFNREKIWEPLHDQQPAHIVPPIANFADGPSGLDYYPGTGFGESYRGRFFLVDFRGTANQSGIRSFRNEADGAFFKLVDADQPIWNILATDFQFGPDGAIYISDWVNGWEGEGKGRIYRFQSQKHFNDPIVAEVQKILASDVTSTPADKLLSLLGHADRRVRQMAQLELADRQETEALSQIASEADSLLAKLHATWALGQIARLHPQQQAAIRSLLLKQANHAEVELRSHSLQILSELGGDGVSAALLNGLRDENARVRSFALMGLYRQPIPDAVQPIVKLIAADKLTDPILRHGYAMALSVCASDRDLETLAENQNANVQLVAVIALRRQASPLVATFLNSSDERVVLEAARAIHDVPIRDAFASLAELTERGSNNDALMRRVLNAHFHLGTEANAIQLARYAANSEAPESLRREAIAMLAQWDQTVGRDRVLGMWRPREAQPVTAVVTALGSVITQFAHDDTPLGLDVGRLASRLKIREGAPVLKNVLKSEKANDSLKAEALVALVDALGTGAANEVEAALSSDSKLEAAALRVVPEALPEKARTILSEFVSEGTIPERQAAIPSLVRIQAADILMPAFQQWLSGTLPAELQLEIREAAEALAADPSVEAILAQVNAKRNSDDPLDMYAEALAGGDANRGRTLFMERVALSCVRCHKVGDQGGEVGPELTRIATDKNRQYLLEAIVAPNKSIAKGFESIRIFDDKGRSFTGVLRAETDEALTLIDADGKVMTIRKETIEERLPGQSAMPTDLVQKLTKAELRDLVEYLSSLNGRRRPGRARPDGPL